MEEEYRGPCRVFTIKAFENGRKDVHEYVKAMLALPPSQDSEVTGAFKKCVTDDPRTLLWDQISADKAVGVVKTDLAGVIKYESEAYIQINNIIGANQCLVTLCDPAYLDRTVIEAAGRLHEIRAVMESAKKLPMGHQMAEGYEQLADHVLSSMKALYEKCLVVPIIEDKPRLVSLKDYDFRDLAKRDCMPS